MSIQGDPSPQKTEPLHIKDLLLQCLRNELVPIDPPIEQKGIEGLLRYRQLSLASPRKLKSHPDSIGYKKSLGKTHTAKCYRIIYGIESNFEDLSSDTIFNCYSFLKRYVLSRYKQCENESAKRLNEQWILQHLDVLFEHHNSLRAHLDILANYHHSLANFMPAPKGFNGTQTHDGKGNYCRDNDMPDIYYVRAEQDFPDKFNWINEYMDRYALQFFKDFRSFLTDGYANGEKNPLDNTDPEKLKIFEQSVCNAICCIEKRAEELDKLMSDASKKELIDYLQSMSTGRERN